MEHAIWPKDGESDWPKGESEMAGRIRAYDWSATPLGAAETWPDDLKVVVDLMLASRFPMFIAWGPDLTLLYNDAYARILAAKHPQALGGRFIDVWKEIWTDILPFIESALAGDATWVEDQPLTMNRHGYDERTWFTFSYSPMRNDTGEIVGIYCAVAETTAQVKLARLREQGETLLVGQQRILELIATGAPLGDTLDALMQFVEVQEPGARAGILIVADDGKHFRRGSGPSLPDAYHVAMDGLPVAPPYLNPCVEAAHLCTTVTVLDIAADRRYEAEWRDLMRSCGLASVRSTPVRGRNGRALASLALYYDCARDPMPANPGLIDIATHLAAVALERDAVEKVRARYAAIVESTDDAIVGKNLNGTILTWNPAAERLFGYTAGEAIGRPVTMLMPPERVVEEEEIMRRIRRGERLEHFETVRCRKGGALLNVSLTISPIIDGNGEIIGASKTARDITERKRAEAALRESEERLRQFGEASSDILWSRDAETLQWVYLTPAFETVYGASRKEAMNGDSFGNWIALIEPEDRPMVLDMIEKVRSGERVSFEFRIRRPSDGALRWLRDTDFPIRDGTGRVTHIGGVARDITSEKDNANRLQVVVAELQHRTRNLIAVVRSIADRTITNSTSLEDFRLRYRDRLAALGRANGLLSRLQDVVTFDELVEAELSAHGGSAGNGQVKLEGPHGIRLRSNAVQTLALAMHELTTNAVKYGALSTPNGKLTVTWRLIDGGNDRLWVDWHETGVTIPVSSLPLTGGGYGRELIEKALPYQLEAETSFDIGPDGIRCTILLPVIAGEV